MPAAHWRAVSECKMNYDTDRTRMKGAQLESRLEMLPGCLNLMTSQSLCWMRLNAF